MSRTRHVGIIVVAVFAIISGLAEVVVGLTGHTFGILSKDLKPNAATAVVGAFYSLGGLALLTMKKWGIAPESDSVGEDSVSNRIIARAYAWSCVAPPAVTALYLAGAPTRRAD